MDKFHKVGLKCPQCETFALNKTIGHINNPLFLQVDVTIPMAGATTPDEVILVHEKTEEEVQEAYRSITIPNAIVFNGRRYTLESKLQKSIGHCNLIARDAQGQIVEVDGMHPCESKIKVAISKGASEEKKEAYLAQSTTGKFNTQLVIYARDGVLREAS